MPVTAGDVNAVTAEMLRKAELRNKELAAENKRLRDALTPSGQTKSDYISEISFHHTEFDEDGDERSVRIIVPWYAMKDFMALIRERAGIE